LAPLAYGIWKSLSMIPDLRQFGDFARAPLCVVRSHSMPGKGDMARLAGHAMSPFLVNNISILIAASARSGRLFRRRQPPGRAMLLFLPLL